MVRYLTLNNKLEYSLSSFVTFLTTNVWAVVCWIFGTYFLPIHTVLGVTFFMIAVDFVTGLWKAQKLKETITSKKLWASGEKLILYFIGIATSFVLQDYIKIDIIQPLWLFATLIITREYLSIIENIEKITGTKLIQIVRSQIGKLLPGINTEELYGDTKKDLDKDKSE